MTNRSWQKGEYLENHNSIWSETKSFFHYFYGLSFTKYFLWFESAPLIYISNTSKELLKVSSARELNKRHIWMFSKNLAICFAII